MFNIDFKFFERYKTKVGKLFFYIFLFTILFLLLLKYFQKDNKNDDIKISKDIEKLNSIFVDIDKNCKIIDFKGKKNNINFLNVISFKGNQIGPLVLENSSNWQGSYLDNNYEVQGIQYQIVKTKYGLFVIPGDGVVLSNGKIVGENIIVNDIDNEYTIKSQFRVKGKNLFFKIK